MGLMRPDALPEETGAVPLNDRRPAPGAVPLLRAVLSWRLAGRGVVPVSAELRVGINGDVHQRGTLGEVSSRVKAVTWRAASLRRAPMLRPRNNADTRALTP